MKNTTENTILTNLLKDKIEITRSDIQKELSRQIENEARFFTDFRKSSGTQREILGQQLENTRKRILELESMQKTPFFAKLVYYSIDENEEKQVYISKYSFTELGISSWVAPVAVLRFEDLKQTQFKLPDKSIVSVDLHEKDSYVITEEKLVYFSNENRARGVSIIYEDFFSNAKTEFGLSEIISKIQKEQYQIIQSDPSKQLIISGPAGSGKTTICLHRVAYLMQSPETENRYSGYKMIMFVQDTSTKEYFSSLLPKLGIERMEITTYFEWGAKLLNLPKIKEIDTFTVDEEYLEYFDAKTNLINKEKNLKLKSSNFTSQLEKIYKDTLSEKDFSIFLKNAKQMKYDYLDISIMLLMIYEKTENKKEKNEGLYRKVKFNKLMENNEIKTVTRKSKVEYSMMIVDEFQNYSQDQLNIIKMCLNKNTNSLTYIGDLNQKNSFKPLSKIHNPNYFDECNKIHLSKVFRNTKQILSYIQSIGYDISVPEEAREGEEITELKINNYTELLKTLETEISKLDKKLTIGILCDTPTIKNTIASKFKSAENLRIMTKQESQGTEFNTAIVVNGSFEESKNENYNFLEMKKSVQRNNDYVGYTRAVEKLIVVKI